MGLRVPKWICGVGGSHKPPKIACKIFGVMYTMGWKKKNKPIDFKKKVNNTCSLHSPRMI